MELWTNWLGAIQSLLTFFSSQVGLGAGLGIVALTLVLRTAILPISWRIAYRGSIRQKKMLRLQPQLARLKLECGEEPRVYAQRVMKLYQDNGMTVMDWRSILGSLVQMPLLLGMYQTLRAGREWRALPMGRDPVASGSLVRPVGGTHDHAGDGSEPGPAGTDAADTHRGAKHIGGDRSIEVLFCARGLLDRFQCLLGHTDRRVALYDREANQVRRGVDRVSAIRFIRFALLDPHWPESRHTCYSHYSTARS